MTNKEISLWIDNDEGLYNDHKASRQSKTAYIKENRAALVEYINRAMQPKKVYSNALGMFVDR